MSFESAVSVMGLDGSIVGKVVLPTIFTTPIRPDLVRAVHAALNKKNRHPYAVAPRAGQETSAESWGTGRAMARIPRVSGGGTQRSGMGAFGNMCRGGRMYAPTKPWRTWHRKVNLRTKRYAVICAIASSGVAALVSARGHRIEKITEVPVVVDDAISSIMKTSTALASLKAVGAGPEMRRGVAWRTIRKGVGKTRNRRYVTIPRILIVYSSNNGVSKAFQNIPGVESISVESLDLLKLAPGGHVGRFLIWTKSAVERIDDIFLNRMKIRKNYIGVGNSCMTNTDLSRIINTDDIQASLNMPKNDSRKRTRIMKKKVPMSKGARATSTPDSKRSRKSRRNSVFRKKISSGEDLEIHGSRQCGTTSTRAIQK